MFSSPMNRQLISTLSMVQTPVHPGQTILPATGTRKAKHRKKSFLLVPDGKFDRSKLNTKTGNLHVFFVRLHAILIGNRALVSIPAFSISNSRKELIEQTKSSESVTALGSGRWFCCLSVQPGYCVPYFIPSIHHS